jgi:hypothetical protein
MLVLSGLASQGGPTALIAAGDLQEAVTPQVHDLSVYQAAGATPTTLWITARAGSAVALAGLVVAKGAGFEFLHPGSPVRSPVALALLVT